MQSILPQRCNSSFVMNTFLPVVILAFTLLTYYYWYHDSFDPGSIRGKRVVVTGASSGIGEHLAYEYCKLGASVLISARRGHLLEKVAAKCKGLGAKEVVSVTSDLGKQKDRDRVIAEVRKEFGGLDHLVLNHAIASPGIWLGTKENMTRLLDNMNVNFISFVDLASQSLSMLTNSNGNIAVVSSVAGKIAAGGQASYSTAKHAMQGFFSALRQELLLRNTGISVTTCVIGAVDTDMMTATKERHKEEQRDSYFSVLDMVATAEDTAVAIIKGLTNRKYEIYYGKLAWIMVAIHNIFPELVEDSFGRQMLMLLKLLD